MSSKQGFASMSEEKHKAASSKGGRSKVPKGLAVFTPEERSARASHAAKARWAKKREERQANEGNVTP